MSDTNRHQPDTTRGRQWADAVLDLLILEGAVTGKVVNGRWKTAAHRATEMLTGVEVARYGAAPSEQRTNYRWVLEAILYLESAGIVKVQRVRPQDGPAMGNPIERIELVD